MGSSVVRGTLVAGFLGCLLFAASAAAKPSGHDAVASKSSAQATRYFPASFFRKRLTRKAPLDPQSNALVAQLRNMAFGVAPNTAYDCRHAVMTPKPQWTAEEAQNCAQLTTRAGVASDLYAPMVYTVGPRQQRVPVVLDSYNPSLARAFGAGVPLPPNAQPSGGTDGQLIVWQPATNTMWEFWRLRREVDGSWHTSGGGVMGDVRENPGHFLDIPDPATAEETGTENRLYIQNHRWGGPSSGIPNLPGLITVNQLRSGSIGHGLVFATWANKPGEWVYPAQNTDGFCRDGTHCSDIPQGARFRLDPRYDVTQIDHPVVRMIAEAVQDYGMVLNNTTGAGVNFYAEGWRGHSTVDPYRGPGGLFETDPRQPNPTQFMREFPWEHLQMVRRGTTCTDPGVQCPATP